VDVDVLVVGAGPAGLTCAIELARRGVGCRVLDRLPAPLPGTRCPVLWQRTLEVMDWMGVAVDELLALGVPLHRKVFHIGNETAEVSTRSTVDSRGFLFPLLAGQNVTEALLTRRLGELGVTVERGSTVITTSQDERGVNVVARDDAGRRHMLRASWLVLATGLDVHGVPAPPGGPVRRFTGLRYACADLELEHPPFAAQEEHIYRDGGGHAGLVPLPDGGYRVSLSYRVDGPDDAVLDADGLQAEAARITGLPITGCAPESLWTVEPQSWLAASFRNGRFLFLGDATKRFAIPVYGFNTAVADAFNLAWKLATVVHGEGTTEWLDSFSTERRDVASVLVPRTASVLGFGSVAPIEDLQRRMRQRVFEQRGEPAEAYPVGRLVANVPATGPLCVGAVVPNLRAVTFHGQVTSLLAALRGATGWTLLLLVDTESLPEQSPRSLASIDVEYPSRIARLIAELESPAGQAASADLPALCLVRPDGHIALHTPLSGIDATRDFIAGLFNRSTPAVTVVRRAGPPITR
jgi:2-polyprenyl-6-methoxyphenol hydroxylase-like FAD-dependent oxidoreductase